MKKITLLSVFIFLHIMTLRGQEPCLDCDNSIDVNHFEGCFIILEACLSGVHDWYLDVPGNTDLYIGTGSTVVYTAPGPGTYEFYHFTVCPDNPDLMLKSLHVTITITCEDCSPLPEDFGFSYEPAGTNDSGCFYAFQAEYTGNGTVLQYTWTVEGAVPSDLIGENPTAFFPAGITSSEVCLTLYFAGGDEECAFVHCETVPIDCGNCEENSPANLDCTLIDGFPFLTWDEVPGATGYYIYATANDPYCPCSNGQPQSLLPIYIETNTVALSDLPAINCFSWTVVAVCPNGGLSNFPKKKCFSKKDACSDPCGPYEFDIDYGDCPGLLACEACWEIILPPGMTSTCNNWTLGVWPPSGIYYELYYENVNSISFIPPGIGYDVELCVTLCEVSDECPTITHCETFENLCNGFHNDPDQFIMGGQDQNKPAVIKHSGNAPNPFGASTTLEFELTKAAPTHIRVYNISGELVWSQNAYLDAGWHQVIIDNFLASTQGVLTYVIEADGFELTGKMIKIDNTE